MSGISGLFEFDLKKIIALSTLRQLGFIIATIRVNHVNLAFFHLITHARFKALLFICVGLFIHYFFDNQDIRSFGLINKNFSFSLSIFNVANLSLCGFPFLSGFFSKDLILELILIKKIGFFFFFIVFFGTFLTVFYTFRLIFFLRFKNSFFFPLEILNKKVGIEYSMILLFFFSIFLGYFGSVYFFFPYNYIIIPFILKIFISILCIISFLFCLIFSKKFFFLKINLIIYLSQIWFLHFLKTDFLKRVFFNFSNSFTKNIVGFSELFMGFYIYKKLFNFSYFINKLFRAFFYYFFLIFLFFILIYIFLIL
uniref:NADH-ubiquinone oxidoreductase chain 5 n=1 Tax=Anthurium amnicola TaxID=1678845 RepID=A0A1D1YTC3_9ARAE